MPASTPSSAALNPNSRPPWPKLTEVDPDRIDVAGVHFCFARRVRLHQTVKALGRGLVLFNVLAMIAFGVGLCLDKTVKPQVTHLAALHAYAIQHAVNLIHPLEAAPPPETEDFSGSGTGWLVLYFFIPLIFGAILRIFPPFFDFLLSPLTLRKTQITITPTEIIVSRGIGTRPKSFPVTGAGSVVFRSEAFPNLDRLRQKTQREREKRERELKTKQMRAQQQAGQDSRKKKGVDLQAELDSQIRRHEEASREEDRWLQWHEEMRYLELISGTWPFRVASFVKQEAAEDFATVCMVAVKAQEVL